MTFACGFDFSPLKEVSWYRLLSFGGTGSGVERCALLGDSKCTISIGGAIGGMKFVRCSEVVCFSEGSLLEVSLYILAAYIPICKS